MGTGSGVIPVINGHIWNVTTKDINFKCHMCEPQNSRGSATESRNSRGSSAGPRPPACAQRVNPAPNALVHSQ